MAINIDFLTCLGDALKAMLKPVAAHTFLGDSLPNQKIGEIYTDGCNCTQPQASTTHELCSRGDSGFPIVGFGRLGRHSPRRMVGSRLLSSATHEPRVQG